MPVHNVSQSLAVAGRFELVREGNVINGLNLENIPAGVSVFLILGNNPRIGPMNNGPITFGAGADFLDVSRGVWLETDTNFPGTTVGGFVSFSSPRQEPGAGGVAQL